MSRKITLTDEGQILDADQQEIGEILSKGNTIKRIEIYPKHQGEGYGRAAIRRFCSNHSERGESEVYIACVTNPALITIIEDLGGEEVSSYVLPIAPHPMLEPGKPDYRIPLKFF